MSDLNQRQSVLQVADVSDGSGIQAAITVGTSAVLAAVGASNQPNRDTLSVFNNGTATIYWGYTSAVTTSSGTPLFVSQERVWGAGPDTTIYLISGTAGQNVRVTERARTQ